ncbi:MAG TPA: histidine kinase [Candidatus Glassbacteria bacterium]|nr:histidine kinase [Candidatus Glassbacteria bacterium]
MITARELLLLVLLVKILAAAAIASIMALFAHFKNLLFNSGKNLQQRLQFGVVLGVPLMFGAALRIILGYQAPDLGMEGAILAGVLGGPVAGVAAGALAAFPALFHQEMLALPFLVAAGALGGLARHLAASKDDIWHFSPFFDLNLYRWFRQRFGYPRGDWQMFFFLLIVVVEAGRMLLGRGFPERLFYLFNGSAPIVIAICLTSIACVAIPITIWKNIRNEMLIEEQRRLLVQARLDALTAQINPHFLFNTLNSIASLARTDPESARQVIFKLSSILRQLLKKHENFSTLRDEIAFVDDYLSIEAIRFGHDKLRIVKEIETDTLPLMVPSMLLQPIIENAIRHGLSPRLEGGEILLRSYRQDGRLVLEVRDNGVGIPAEVLDRVFNKGAGQQGIGISNVRERLRVLYGSDCIFRITSATEGGTSIQMGIPLLGN